ncbi:Twin-arginine translocation protein TatA [hydrothermal vent metagenome]|uniref:Twin-arginine translocation protein TatA n=1 Tax=hydrothermal vent metagenome TaxID=652676 RepID=A0A1W1EJZ0_9ZZZZ
MGMPSMPELLIVLAIVILLFGAKKIPDLAKGMGKAIKGFKKEMKEDDEVVASKEIDEKKASTEEVAKTTTNEPKQNA